MNRSLPKAVNFISRLHLALVASVEAAPSAANGNLEVYPMIDGAYIVSNKSASIRGVLKEVMIRLAKLFVNETEFKHRFLVRASVAYGLVATGQHVSKATDGRLNAEYAKPILVGMCVANAYESEKFAPPFGIYVHESARASSRADGLLGGSWYRWWADTDQNRDLAEKLYKSLDSHFKHCLVVGEEIGYAREKLGIHRERMDAYFWDVKSASVDSPE